MRSALVYACVGSRCVRLCECCVDVVDVSMSHLGAVLRKQRLQDIHLDYLLTEICFTTKTMFHKASLKFTMTTNLEYSLETNDHAASPEPSNQSHTFANTRLKGA